jgi:hypothetical protein
MGSTKENITTLKDFFDKDHDYYTANGLYSPTKKAMN